MGEPNKLRIKEWAEEDRPREKLLLKGISSLSDAELLAILIGSGNRDETAVELAKRILNAVDNNLNDLSKLPVRELVSRFRGIGTARAITIVAALELGKRRHSSSPSEHPYIKTSHDLYSLFYSQLCDLPYEELWVAKLMGIQLIDHLILCDGSYYSYADEKRIEE